MTRFIAFSFPPLRSLITAIIIICIAETGWGQHDYRVIQYTSADGLPQNSIKDMAFDHQGFLWIATEGGI